MLSEVVNIGKELEKRLEAVGIQNLADLAEVGPVGVLLRLDALQAPGCLNMLYALEGALRGMRWHNLPAEVKNAMKTELAAVRRG